MPARQRPPVRRPRVALAGPTDDAPSTALAGPVLDAASLPEKLDDPSWVKEALAAFADDVIGSVELAAKIEAVVEERTAPLRAEVADLRAELAEAVENVAALAALLPPRTPYPADAGRPHSPTALLQRAKESVLMGGGGRGTRPAPTSRFSVTPARVCVVAALAVPVLALLAPTPGAVADAVPVTFGPVVEAPMAGSPAAPIPTVTVAVQPAHDAKFATTTTTR